MVALGNLAELDQFAPPEAERTSQLRHELGVPEGVLLVAYIGGFSRNRALLPLIEATSYLPNVQFHLWGGGRQRDLVRTAVSRHSNTRYHGWLPAQRSAISPVVASAGISV